MMVFLSVVLAVLGTVTCDKPLSRDKRFAVAYAGFPFGPYFGPVDPFPFPFASAGAFPFARTGDYYPSSRTGESASSSRTGESASTSRTAGGSYAGAAPNWDYPRAPYFPFSFMPFPVITIPKPWYEGENICKEVRYANTKQPEEFGDWMTDEFPTTFSDFSAEHQTCKGSNTKHVCVKSFVDKSGQTKLEGTKYECCYGFVRNPSGPGCVESSTSTGTGGKSRVTLNQNDKNFYRIVPQSGSVSSSTIRPPKSLSSVPLQ